MSLTHENYDFYAMLWLKTAQETVLDQHDAALVSSAAIASAEATTLFMAKPCAMVQPAAVRDAKERVETRHARHSSWVH